MSSPNQDPRDAEITNPLREEQRHAIRDELEGRLRHRGASLAGAETDEEILDLSNAVEAFERAVMLAGGDLMVDTPESSQPDNPAHVLPQRQGEEGVDAYVSRIRRAADQIRV